MTDTMYTSEIEIQTFIITKMTHFSIRLFVTFDESQRLSFRWKNHDVGGDDRCVFINT
jgi:hypothetical protein